jgi:hypothetical protein
LTKHGTLQQGSEANSIHDDASALCAVYSVDDWSMAVFPANCVAASANTSLGTTWS